jgi:response regulator RpfG family c-di-GMP phosphodiesterase
VILTGLSDREVAIEALHRGAQDYICKADMTGPLLERLIRYAIERARNVRAEHELLEATVTGSIRALTEVLALSNPMAFGRAMRVKQWVSEVAESLVVDERWALEVAAMVSQIGWLTVPPDICERFHTGKALSSEDRTLIAGLPGKAEQILAGIPRLEPVRELLRLQVVAEDGSAAEQRANLALPIPAQVLRIALALDHIECTKGPPSSPRSRRTAGFEDLRTQAGLFFLERDGLACV